MKIKCEIPFDIKSRNGVIYTKESFQENNYIVPLYLGTDENPISLVSESCVVDVLNDKLEVKADINNESLESLINLTSFAPRCICELSDNKVINAKITSVDLVPTNECAIDSKCKIEK